MTAQEKYPHVEIMLGGETTALREMTEAEKADYDFINGSQWSIEEVKRLPKSNEPIRRYYWPPEIN